VMPPLSGSQTGAANAGVAAIENIPAAKVEAVAFMSVSGAAALVTWEEIYFRAAQR